MPKLEPTGPAQSQPTIIPDVAALLIRLGPVAARLVATPGSTMRISVAGNAAGPGVEVPEHVTDAARTAGYLVAAGPAAQDGEILSPAGRAALRATLMARPAATGDRRRTNKLATPSRTSAAARAVPQRSVERLALVEQLGLRRDAHGQPLLKPMDVAAGLRIAHDFAIGQMQPRITARWSAEAMQQQRRRASPGIGVELAASTAAAQSRVRAALSALGSLANIVLDVCCLERGLEVVEKTQHWPRGTARIVLGFALDKLAAHYGMTGTGPATGTTRQWADGDFIPSAAAWTKR